MMITLLVDLDGTITDPAPGMIGGFRFALKRLGVPPPPVEDLRWIIGPPTRLSFPKFLRPDQDVEEAVRLYRERYGADGLFEARLRRHAGSVAGPARTPSPLVRLHGQASDVRCSDLGALRARVRVHGHLRPGPCGPVRRQGAANRSHDRGGEH